MYTGGVGSKPFTLRGVGRRDHSHSGGSDILLFHPSGLTTLRELDYVNPSKSQTAIRQHLRHLVDAGIVEEVLLPEDRR